MKILAIDYGRAKVGLAVSSGILAEPLCVIRYKRLEELVRKVEQVVQVEQVEKVVVGVSEGKMGIESKDFSLSLSQNLRGAKPDISVETWDETLSTHEAQKVSIEAGMSRKKRRSMEDAFAAAIMLQNYLDSRLTL
jgi:putative Holliday junction resolvase